MFLDAAKREKVLKKELLAVEKQEARLQKAAMKEKAPTWKQELERRVPEKAYSGLEAAFCKGFALVFQQGRGIIEKSYKKESLQADHAVRDYAVRLKGGKKELRQIHKTAKQSGLVNLAVTTAEGVGLGALGIGMPDVVLFLGTLLKGIYETALHYGFDYESRQEQYLILKMMTAALSTGETWYQVNDEVDQLLTAGEEVISQEQFDGQIKAAAQTFAVDMLVLKFIQGFPIVGILGGAANPVYYNKVMKYVQVKYRKRYLLGKEKTGLKL